MFLAAIFVTLLVSTAGPRFALPSTTVRLTGEGSLAFIDEVRVCAIRVIDADKVVVRLEATSNMIA